MLYNQNMIDATQLKIETYVQRRDLIGGQIGPIPIECTSSTTKTNKTMLGTSRLNNTVGRTLCVPPL